MESDIYSHIRLYRRQAIPEVILSDKGKNRSFSQSAEDSKSVYDIICAQYPDTLEAADEKVMHQLGSYADTSALKQLILLPPVRVLWCNNDCSQQAIISLGIHYKRNVCCSSI